MKSYTVDEVARLKAVAAARIDEYSDAIVALSRRIHDNPEVAFEERQTSQWLTEALQEWTVAKVQLGVADLPTAFVATLDSGRPGPTLAFVAEYDALPGIGHGCGHNLICAIAVASAVGIQAALPELAGRIQVIGTPAEEGGGGKVIMIQKGIFQGVDAALMIHPLDECKIGEHLLALSGLTIEMHGKAVHASAKAHEGINALYALMGTFQSINNLRESFQPTDRVHGIITHGGERPNIIPAFARGEFYVRGATRQRVNQLMEQVKNCARGAALATGARAEFPPSKLPDLDSSRINATLNDAFARNLTAQGFTPRQVTEDPLGASNDLSNVSQLLPTSEVTVPIGPKGLQAHSVDFVQAACSDVAFDALIRGAKAEVGAAIALLTHPGLLEQVKQDYAKG
jgi:amidohydrolase